MGAEKRWPSVGEWVLALFISLVSGLFIACVIAFIDEPRPPADPHTTEGKKVRIDSTGFYTYAKNGLPVTGKVLFEVFDEQRNEPYVSRTRQVVEGRAISGELIFWNNWLMAECREAEYRYDERGAITHTLEYLGKETIEYFAQNPDSVIQKSRDYKGTLLKQVISVGDSVVSEWNIEPAFGRLELVLYRTGFYATRDLAATHYHPIVIAAWKNNSDRPIDQCVEIVGEFANRKAIGWRSSAYHHFNESPWMPGQIKVVTLKLDRDYYVLELSNKAKTACHIFIDGQFYRTIEVENALLSSKKK